LKKQGANNGATTAFLISTPESGVDSISATYALLDPLMTIARPMAAFIGAMAAGIFENIWTEQANPPELKTIDQTCAENIIPPTMLQKIAMGLKFAVTELWNELALWFGAGLLIAGLITVMVPQQVMTDHLGGGLKSMLWMLVAGIPLYICATASTPIAAAMILKGVSPGAALVFLLAGPATNITSLSVLLKILGKRASFFYLAILSMSAVTAGLCLDMIYEKFNLDPVATIGQAGEVIPPWLSLSSAILLAILSLPILWKRLGCGSSTYDDKCNCSHGSNQGIKPTKTINPKDNKT